MSEPLVVHLIINPGQDSERKITGTVSESGLTLAHRHGKHRAPIDGAILTSPLFYSLEKSLKKFLDESAQIVLRYF